MVGVVADAQRARVSRGHWDEFLEDLSALVGQEIQEIHTHAFYRGAGIWRQLDGAQRRETENRICDWLIERHHSVIYSAVDKTKFATDFNREEIAVSIGSVWLLMATHLCLSLQKHHQSFPKNKGNTILIFDEEVQQKDNFLQFVLTPPDWTDSYYKKEPKQARLDQILDVPHFVDSKHVGLIQLADFASFILRRHIELHFGDPEKFAGEKTHIDSCAGKIIGCSIPKSAIFMDRGRCQVADTYRRYAPACVL